MPDPSLTVLYADVSGSTRLYEEHGDIKARAAIALCIDLLSAVVEKFQGRVVKTIGDEVMCAFTAPVYALLAAGEMQLAVRSAGEEEQFVTGPLRIKIGMHFGPGIEQKTDVFGEASILAQQVINQAKADQILISRETFDALTPELRVGSRPFDRISAEGRDAMLEIIEMIWEVTDVTQMSEAVPVSRNPGHSRLHLTYRDVQIDMGEDRAQLTLGRTDQNDLMVPAPLASRVHAEIEFRSGRFHLRDMSTNGTVITPEGEAPNQLRGERMQLRGRGTICLGGSPKASPDGLIEYECVD